ncbi:sacsin N-terminal ATP-binding-like domain-containing protein [Nostoc sp. CALU 546]|uniref:sacsin N-terminal ATP-binding-like domain-containing protein n=1 Tax=Nostoc sp. CALU 546 TaxID=1867241 RepID=UPI003B674021
MVSNYKQLTEENIIRYGTDIDDYGPVFLTSLYSDRTHFIYELLQNAEDAGATKVNFKLFNDHLKFYHNGRLFTEADVQGICGLVKSTKKEDLTKIGKFGIGFKSVYAYTDSPEIHSGDEHFFIEHYVRPHAVMSDVIISREYTTLFIIKFNKQDLSKAAAYQEIETHLRKFNPRNLLFLNYIEEISWHLEKGQQGIYKREILEHDAGYKRVTIKINTSFDNSQETWIIFGKPVPYQLNLKVEVAFLVQKDKKTQQEQIVPVSNSQLVVFFPTEKETHLNFLLQGPYRTTPDRAKIPPNDSFNQKLIEITADLVASVLLKLKDLGLLTVSFLQILPIRASEFPENTMFYPVFNEVCEAFQENALLPTPDGRYIPAIQAKLARSTALRKLLSDTQLQQLYGDNYTWLSDEISRNTTPELCQYIRDILKVEEIEPDKFASKFSLDFITQQSDNWVAEFYTFLIGQEALWKEETHRKNPPLLNKPFIRLQNDKHVTPFDYHSKKPNAYLPTEVPTSKATVKVEVVAIPEAKIFLERLGLEKPSSYTEVRDHIIRKYKVLKQIDEEENKKDIKIIEDALQISSSTERKQLIEQLKDTPFLLCINAKTNKQEYQSPEKIYFRSKSLEMYFEGNEAAWFLDNNNNIFIDHELLIELGISETVRYYYSSPNAHGYVILSDSKGNHKRGIKGFDPNFSIDGLAHTLENPTYDKSSYIWNYLLLPNRQRLSGVIELSKRVTYQDAQKEKCFSKVWHQVSTQKWLPNSLLKLCQANTLSLDDISKDFIRDEKDEDLATCIGVKPRASLLEEATRIGILPELLDYLRKNPRTQKLWVEKLIKGASSEGTRNNGTGSITTSSNGTSPEPEAPSIDYITALKEVFSQPGKTELNEAFEPSPVANPEARLQKIQDSIRNDKENEPSAIERFKKIESKTWEGKNKEIVTFLKETYNGKCQICSETFPKRNGEAYFERVYLVSYTKARWIDQPGNVLCLCPTCCAKFKHGSVDPGDDIEEQINSLPLTGGKLHIELCGQDTYITFLERHIIALQGLLKGAVDSVQ